MEVQYDIGHHTKQNVAFLQGFIDSHAINTAGVHSQPFHQISILFLSCCEQRLLKAWAFDSMV